VVCKNSTGEQFHFIPDVNIETDLMASCLAE